LSKLLAQRRFRARLKQEKALKLKLFQAREPRNPQAANLPHHFSINAHSSNEEMISTPSDTQVTQNKSGLSSQVTIALTELQNQQIPGKGR
jgi:hypothetical protein